MNREILPRPSEAHFLKYGWSRIIPPKPTLQRKRTEKPQGTRPMTIGIGMLCSHGAIIAADTRIARDDGSTHSARKVRIEKSANGVFVVAYAADDTNAAKTLIDDLMEDLVKDDPSTLREVEGIVRPQMAKWAAAYPYGAPNTELILGASVSAPWVPDRQNRGGLGLYFCQPPNTMNLQHFLDPDPSIYIGIGQGSSITDTLYKGLFGSMTDPKTCLKQIAYLMYRAKKDFANGCGGDTTAVFLRESEPAAFEIAPIWMQTAETASVLFDNLLNIASSAILSQTKGNAIAVCDHFRSVVETVTALRIRRFCTMFNQEICDDGIVRQFPVDQPSED
jgi:hypothetical protein